MRALEKFVNSWAIICFLFFISLFVATLHFLPIDIWMVVNRIYIADGKNSAQLEMAVNRIIKRDFFATRNTTIRRWEEGGWVTRCDARGEGNYRKGAKFPKVLTLAWWTENQCHPLPVGKYIITTTWTVSGLGIVPDKSLAVDSNIFEVLP
jgi:hypothetical protein